MVILGAKYRCRMIQLYMEKLNAEGSWRGINERAAESKSGATRGRSLAGAEQVLIGLCGIERCASNKPAGQ